MYSSYGVGMLMGKYLHLNSKKMIMSKEVLRKEVPMDSDV